MGDLTYGYILEIEDVELLISTYKGLIRVFN